MDRDQLNSALSAHLDRLAGGDLTARDEIISLCADRLRTLAHRLLAGYPTVRRWDDTDDVFQNAAMRLYRALAQVRVGSPRDLMALATTQLHRELLDLARHHSGPTSHAANHGTNVARRGAAPGQSVVHHVDRMPETDDHLDRWTAFHETIERLPAEQRELFHLVWHLGADQKTIARLLDCSERTVKTRWREVREAVKGALDGQAPE
jgi:RNA polymerase sigma factor (sigma-70 family)